MWQSPDQNRVQQFCDKFGVYAPGRTRIPDATQRNLCISLIQEELGELAHATPHTDLPDDPPKPRNTKQVIPPVADALADLLYVVHYAGCVWGIDLQPVFEEVHRSNMTKVWPDGTVHRRDDGKILKPDTYERADIVRAMSAPSRTFVTVVEEKLSSRPGACNICQVYLDEVAYRLNIRLGLYCKGCAKEIMFGAALVDGVPALRKEVVT